MRYNSVSMSTFRIQGGTPLFGSVRVGGAKNASYKLMIAALLADSPSRILNFSHISDVTLVAHLITALGAKAQEVGERCYTIDPQGLRDGTIGSEHGEASRASIMFIPALLHRFGTAIVPEPGGDKIGKRPLERHFDGLKALGVQIEQRDGMIQATSTQLIGTTYRFEKNTHTGTEMLIMAAVKAKGKTILENAAEESEIDDLIDFLNAMGGKVARKPGRIIEIDGVEHLQGAIHKILPDRNQIVSFAVAALATKGDIIVENAKEKDLTAFLRKLDEIGAGYEVGSFGIRFFYKGDLIARDIQTAIHPGFMTDWQPLWVVLMTQANALSRVFETVSQNRFQYVESLREMGADISLYNIDVPNPEEVYNFNWGDRLQDDFHAAKVKGPTHLHAGEFEVKDLRHGATLMIAGMCATGTTILHDPKDHIDRGYERLDEQFNSMGAKIVREP
jgi:UDP-N-acetylglucosamine 1-carboxyvinyltransferase